MSQAIKPSQFPVASQVAKLVTAIEILDEDSRCPLNWRRLMLKTWALVKGSMTDKTTSDKTDLGILALQISRAGAGACAKIAETEADMARYEWMLAGRAHRIAAGAITVGWPALRPIYRTIPTEFSNLRSQETRSIIVEPGYQELQILLIEPLASVSRTAMMATMEKIATSVYLDGF